MALLMHCDRAVKYDRIVIGYHGCERRVAEAVLAGKEVLRPSVNDYDWLGKGIYFWEYGPERALHFAAEKLKRQRNGGQPAIVGALLQLGKCFDLLDTRFTGDLVRGYARFREYMRANGVALPANAGSTPDRLLRRRDCAALNWYLRQSEQGGERFDCVRGAFREGQPVFSTSGIYRKTHIQIAVRNLDCVIGVFRPILETGR